MLKKRLIGVVTVKNGWAVQSFGYQKYLPLGKPECLVENLDRWGTDEILVQVIDRSLTERGPDFELLEKLGRLGLGTPLIYGGGIRNVEEGMKVIQSGALYLQVAALIGPIYPVFFITSALFQAVKLPILSLYMTIIRLTLIPFLSLWYVINIKGGEYQDIFYTIMGTNWLMGIAVLAFIPFFLRKKLRMSFKKLFVF